MGKPTSWVEARARIIIKLMVVLQCLSSKLTCLYPRKD
jgi:hypothetical protein